MKITALLSTSALGLAATIAATSAFAGPNFAGVAAKDVALFYPGQSSFEWIMTDTDHSGATKFKAGKNCAQCHVGDEANMGNLIVSGKQNEAAPPAGKPGSIDSKVQFAHDDQNLYVRIVFSEGNQPNMKMDNATATKVTMMLDDGGVAGASRAGCFYMCHDDSAGMASAGTADRTMYLGNTRAHLSRQGGGDALKPDADLEKMKQANGVLEYWQARLNAGAPAQAVNGTIFDKRAETKPTVVTADATNSGGTWTVTFTRKLNAGAGFLPIVAGKTYTVAFAIHSGHAAKRFHYVSFERSLVLDQGSADFVAAKK